MRALLLALLLVSCGTAESADPPGEAPVGIAASPTQDGHGVALLAGGCFWCLESAFDPLDGVISAESGYAGGTVNEPTYKQVGRGKTGHTEVVRVVFDLGKLSYEQVLEVFWLNHDPFDPDGQFCDQGSQYRPAIFPMDAEQKRIALAQKGAKAELLGKAILTHIEPAATFWRAEGYHQDFWKTNATHYQRYRAGCGRDRRLQEVWGKAAKH